MRQALQLGVAITALAAAESKPDKDRGIEWLGAL